MVQKTEVALYELVRDLSFLRQAQDMSERSLRSEESLRFSQVNGMLPRSTSLRAEDSLP